MRTLLRGVLLVLLFWTALLPAAVECEGWGAVRGIRIDGELMRFHAGISVPWRGWTQMAQTTQGMVQDIKFQRAGGQRTYSGRLAFNDGRSVSYQQVVQEIATDCVRVSFEVTANDDLDIEGVFASISVPVADFQNGQAGLVGSERAITAALAAAPMMQDNHILGGEGTGLRLTSAKRCLEFVTAGKQAFLLQDERKYQSDAYSCSVCFQSGRLAKGQTVKASYTIRVAGTVDHTPAQLTVDSTKSLYTFDGFGGNFVFRPDSPASLYCLDHLRVAWGRVWMPLHAWEPENDNSSPAETDMATLRAHDQPGTELHNCLQMAAELQKRKIPYIASIWPMPKWLLANPGSGPFDAGRQIAPDKWDEVCESIGSYLLYARQQYGVEPQLFSFNESDVGVTVKMTAQEHCEAIKRLGAHFQKLGLKTRLLLGDTADPRQTVRFIEPTLNDPAALQYVGAIALHSYGLGAAKDYTDLAAVAARAKLPLLVSEVGLDASAFNYPGTLSEPWSAVDEAAVYQQLLLHARPQSLMEWEYSEDLPVVEVDRGQNPPAVKPTKRFWQLKQFGDLIPRPAMALAVTSDHPDLLFTAFGDVAKGVYTFHLVNTGPSRQVTLSGLPTDLRGLRTYVTDESRDMYEVPTLAIGKGSMQMGVPARAVVTLTNLPQPGPRVPAAVAPIATGQVLGQPVRVSQPARAAAPVSAPVLAPAAAPAVAGTVIASWDQDLQGWAIHKDNGQEQAEGVRVDAAGKRLALTLKEGCRWAISKQDASLAGKLAGRKLMLDVTVPAEKADQWLQLSIGMLGQGIEAQSLPMQSVVRNGQKQTLTFDLSGVKLPQNPNFFILWIITNTAQGSTPGEIYLDEMRVQ